MLIILFVSLAKVSAKDEAIDDITVWNNPFGMTYNVLYFLEKYQKHVLYFKQ